MESAREYYFKLVQEIQSLAQSVDTYVNVSLVCRIRAEGLLLPQYGREESVSAHDNASGHEGLVSIAI